MSNSKLKKITSAKHYFFTTKCKRFPKSINIIPTVQRHS